MSYVKRVFTQSGIFFVPFDPCQATDPIPFSDEGQSLYDLLGWRPPTIEDRPFGLRKGLPTCLTFTPLSPRFGPTKLDKIGLTLVLFLTMISTGCIGTKITCSRKFWHLFLLVENRDHKYKSYFNNTQAGDYPFW
jgi:hypothetical protein